MRAPILVAVFALSACGGATPSAPAVVPSFGAPDLVTITGYDGDAMEPFISDDDQVLLFNDSNTGTNTELHWATRTDDLTFLHMGLLASANSPALDAVPSLCETNELYWVSTRSYDTTSSTLYRGQLDETSGTVSGIDLVPGVSKNTPGIVEFDAEISRDGSTLYYVVSKFVDNAPSTADLAVAFQDFGAGTFDPQGGSLLAGVNTSALEYAPASSATGLELYFTRTDGSSEPALFVATRASVQDDFSLGAPLSFTGYVEGPALSADGKSLYFHRKDTDGFHVYRSTRQ